MMGKILYTLGENAQCTTKKYDGDAGWDLVVSEDIVIQPGETHDVHTNICIKMPGGIFGRITGRSSSLRKHNLLINEGIIDNEYTGELFVCVHNLGDSPKWITRGMRIAQIIFHKIEDVNWIQVSALPNIPNSRGRNGFGSTGV